MTDTPAISTSRLTTRILDDLRVPAEAPWYVAFSGGLDSTALLHCLVGVAREAGVRLTALHADHGLSPRSADWRTHCERQCGDWGVECRTARLALDHDDKRGPEGRARDARYAWFRATVGEAAWLFTAHHLGDQAETVIERLARGSGPRGLRGMQPVTRLYGMNVVRPLLDVPREALQAYAEHHRLTWVDDESNEDPAFARNYIRSRVLPVLARRWPDIETALSRTARTMVDAESVLVQTAREDLARGDARTIRGDPSLHIPALQAIDPPRRRNALRHWIHRELGVNMAFHHLSHVSRAVERHPEPAGGMNWPAVELRVHRDRLYLLAAETPPPVTRCWDLKKDLEIGGGITLHARPGRGNGLRAEAGGGDVQVSFRRGGERCRLPGRAHHHTVKQMLQEAGIPPWQRDRLPLIVIDNEVAAIADLVYCEPYAAASDEEGIEIDVVYHSTEAC